MTHNESAYNPDQYWENRGGPSYRQYTESADYLQYHEAQREFFTSLIVRLRPRRLLDFGCGTGKLFPIWKEVPEVHAYDRAQSQIEVARREAAQVRPDNPYRVLHYVAPERAEMPYDDDFFDLVVAAEVLLHVVPADIGPLLDELRRICCGHIAIVTAAPFANAASHCFNHDYTSLCMGRFDLLDDHAVLKQRYLVGRSLPASGKPGDSQSSLERSNSETRMSNAIVTS